MRINLHSHIFTHDLFYFYTLYIFCNLVLMLQSHDNFFYIKYISNDQKLVTDKETENRYD